MADSNSIVFVLESWGAVVLGTLAQQAVPAGRPIVLDGARTGGY